MCRVLKGDDSMSRAGLLCRGHFYPGITRSDPSGSRRVFTKRFFKAVRMSSILPDAPCCWFCSAAGPASVITWKNLIPATFYTAWGNPILLMELHFILGRDVIRAGTSWKDNGISSGLVGMLLVGMEHALGASKRKKKKREQNLTWTLALSVTSWHILWFCPLDFPFSWARSPFPVSRSRFNVLVTPGHVGFLCLTRVL